MKLSRNAARRFRELAHPLDARGALEVATVLISDGKVDEASKLLRSVEVMGGPPLVAGQFIGMERALISVRAAKYRRSAKRSERCRKAA